MPARTLHLHIGIPKTGTTYLQTGPFTSLHNLQYVPVPHGDRFTRGSEDRGRGLMAFCMRRSATLWRDIGNELFQEMLGPREAQAEGRNALISDESIGRAGSRPALLQAHLSGIRQKASDWGFDRVTVLCAVRRQDHWYASHYAQISDRNPHASQTNFEEALDRLLDPAQGRYMLGMLLDYASLHRALAGALGEGNVLMAPYEELKEVPERFIDRLSAFLETPLPTPSATDEGSGERNVRSCGATRWKIQPFGNRSGRRARIAARVRSLHPHFRRRAAIELTPELSDRMLTAYAASNRALAETLDLDLRQYGYL